MLTNPRRVGTLNQSSLRYDFISYLLFKSIEQLYSNLEFHYIAVLIHFCTIGNNVLLHSLKSLVE